MSTTPSESFFLELSIRPTQFAPASIENAVFFDENNEQVISVHNETKISIQTKRDAKGTFDLFLDFELLLFFRETVRIKVRRAHIYHQVFFEQSISISSKVSTVY